MFDCGYHLARTREEVSEGLQPAGRSGRSQHSLRRQARMDTDETLLPEGNSQVVTTADK